MMVMSVCSVPRLCILEVADEIGEVARASESIISGGGFESHIATFGILEGL